MHKDEWHVRLAQTGDGPRIAAIQIESWTNTYHDALPPEYFASQMATDINTRWAKPFTQADLVLCGFDANGEMQGFLAVLLRAGRVPYIDNLHVLGPAQGRGLADCLMGEVARHLLARREDSVCLTVLDKNARARAFYARLGGIEGPRQPDDMFGQPVHSFPVTWSDLVQLQKSAPRV